MQDFNKTSIVQRVYGSGEITYHGFDYQEPPFVPSGFTESHKAYKLADKSEKPDLWKGMNEEFKGYFLELDRIKSENLSNLLFFREMRDHFKKVGVLAHTDKLNEKIYEYESKCVS